MNVNKLCSCGKLIRVNERCSCKNRKSKQERKRNQELTTATWKAFRLQIIKRDLYHCQRCSLKYKEFNADGRQLQIHHIKPRINYPELMYEATNCVTLCRQCNSELGTRETLDFNFKAEELEYHPTL